ncbi:IS3 family transposase [Lysinibacillus pakistanensis]|uniref:IS3 family transposase n=1 Tax=Lysinibacillus pakistanensis TaxID=759811 RepID=A0ABX6DL78_9BACI|nr:IS3 family transposase [Lysinibacillus pakistanensis]
MSVKLNCIEYYNHKRIKEKLKGLSSVRYRIQSFIAASTISHLRVIIQ